MYFFRSEVCFHVYLFILNEGDGAKLIANLKMNFLTYFATEN